MSNKNPFKWKHYQSEIILLCVRWYLSYPLSYRNLEEMMMERGLGVVHTTIMHWVHQYAIQINQKIRCHLKLTNDSQRVDETYIKVKKRWMYLYRAVDSQGNTIDFMLSKTRDMNAAMRFFEKALNAEHVPNPRVVNVDKNLAYPPAFDALKKEKKFAETSWLRQVRYLNNIVEQDHRAIKRIINAGLGFDSFETASKTISGIEAMHMIKKRQIKDMDFSVSDQVKFINGLFGIAA